jgi:hypothetical protein
MLMILTSFSNPEYEPRGPSGEREAVGRYWTFIAPDAPGVLDLFVECPGALPIPTPGATYRVSLLPEGPGFIRTGLIGLDRRNNSWYRILKADAES